MSDEFNEVTAPQHLVFVYGSLLYRLGNHGYISDQMFIGEYITKHDDYSMYSFQDAFPMVTKKGGTQRIRGELYLVDDKTFAALDRLESNGTMYQREEVALDGFDKPVWMYLYMGDGDGLPKLSPSKECNNVLNWFTYVLDKQNTL